MRAQHWRQSCCLFKASALQGAVGASMVAAPPRAAAGGACVGPDALRWEPIATPGCGAVTGLAISPAFVHDGTCFAATMAGLFRSEDAGERWSRVGEPHGARSATALAISPAYGENGTLLVADLEAGVYRVVAGRWTISDLAGYGVQVAALATSPVFGTDGTAFAASLSHGIFCTHNHGAHWETCNFGLLDLEVLALAVSPGYSQDETIFAATATGLFRSRNGGRAWRESASLGDGMPVLCLAPSPAFATDGVVFAGTDGAGLFRSADSGATWHPCDGFPGDACVNGVACSAACASDATAAAITDSDVYLSYSGGARWSLQAHVPDPLCLALAPAADATALLLVGTAGGDIYRTWIGG